VSFATNTNWQGWDKGIKGDLGFKFRFYRCGDTDGWFSNKNARSKMDI
jgi:hypothetical protein